MTKKCPICRTEWTGQHFVGERAVTTTEKYLQGKRRSGGVTNSASNHTPIIEESENHDDNEEGETQG